MLLQDSSFDCWIAVGLGHVVHGVSFKRLVFEVYNSFKLFSMVRLCVKLDNLEECNKTTMKNVSSWTALKECV
jgi:hypothetical protein